MRLGLITSSYPRHPGESVNAGVFVRSFALELAARNFSVQREPRDARVLLESALAAREPEAAAPALAWLERTGLEDSRLSRLARDVEALR